MTWKEVKTNCTKQIECNINRLILKYADQGLSVELRLGTNATYLYTDSLRRDIAPCHNVGYTPTLATDKARFYDSEWNGYMEEGCSIAHLVWVEVDKDFTDCNSRVWDHGEWSFFQEWKELYDFLHEEEVNENDYKLREVKVHRYNGPTISNLERKMKEGVIY